MEKWYFNIVPIFFIFCPYNAHSQINCTVPLPPVLTLVSLQPETGNTELNWTLSPSSDISAYIIYSYKDGDGTPIDTLWNPAATSYTYSSTAYKYFSVSYVVAAYRLPAIPGMPGCPSPLSNVLTTVFCSSEIDTCKKKIKINWNNYTDYPEPVLGYKIFVSENYSPLSETDSVNNLTDTLIISDFAADSNYCFMVETVLEDGSVSTSNKSCLSTKMQRVPQWINADFATVDINNKISLQFSVDPSSEITHFSLEKKTGASGTFQEIAQPESVNASVAFTDDQADVNTINYYRLTAINNCNNPVTVSNICSNIVLSLNTAGNNLNLTWNSYKEWLGAISSYVVFVNTGKGFEEKAVLQPSDTVFTLAYQEIMYEVTENEVCFHITASETANPHGITGQTTSSGICTAPIEIITVPNVFTPNNDMVNDLFRPVLSFTPVSYHLVISDRQGNILFESRDSSAAWDGSRNGNPQPQGVYLWFLKVTTPTGKNISRTGTITLIHDK